MPIDTVETEVKKRKSKLDTPPAPSEVSNEGIEAAERVLTAMHTNPQATITRMTFSLTCTIPTGNYENLTPKIEIEYLVPEGAVVPNEVEQLEILRAEISTFIYPLVEAQTMSINTKAAAMLTDETKAKLDMAASFVAASPLFKWLTTFNRPLAARLLTNRIAFYKDM